MTQQLKIAVCQAWSAHTELGFITEFALLLGLGLINPRPSKKANPIFYTGQPKMEPTRFGVFVSFV